MIGTDSMIHAGLNLSHAELDVLERMGELIASDARREADRIRWEPPQLIPAEKRDGRLGGIDPQRKLADDLARDIESLRRSSSRKVA